MAEFVKINTDGLVLPSLFVGHRLLTMEVHWSPPFDPLLRSLLMDWLCMLGEPRDPSVWKGTKAEGE